jgi:hypothetical protein
LRKGGAGSTIRNSKDENTRNPWAIFQPESALGAPRKIESQIQARAHVAGFIRENHYAPLVARNYMGRNDDLPGLADKIAASLATKPQLLLIHPAELRVLRSMTDQELRSFAKKNGWSVVRRLGGHQIEFYNDAGTRAAM